MIATRYAIKQMIRYHLLNTGQFEGTGLFRPIGLFSHHDASAARPSIGSEPGAAGRGFPEDGTPPPYQGYACAHRSLFWQFSLGAGSLAASILPRLGAGVWVSRCAASVLAPRRVGGKSSIVFGEGKEKRTPRSLRLRLSLLGDLLWVGAHALSRAPTGALSGKVF